MLIADLSIDYDFFVRECESWGFDCDDTPFHATDVWLERYRRIDLVRETDLARYADFQPKKVVEALASKGITLLPHRDRCRVGIADSHVHAYDFFRASRSPADLILNLDAHHDLFDNSAELHCGNWGTWMLQAWPDLRFMQVYPSWKDPEEDCAPVSDAEIHRWDSWNGEAGGTVAVRHIFLCRSAGWVPPHHDAEFLTTATEVAKLGRARWIETVAPRNYAA